MIMSADYLARIDTACAAGGGLRHDKLTAFCQHGAHDAGTPKGSPTSAFVVKLGARSPICQNDMRRYSELDGGSNL